jgi:tetratricopeptide (TPR) repeat protein
MELAHKLLLAGHSSVSDAKQAYFAGDFERCLEICANVRVSTLTTASEVALLRGRAYLRTGRPHEAQAAITETTHATLDASLTAQMLLATARIRQNDADTGLAMLKEAASRAQRAHFAIRSEIAFSTALGYWAKRDVDSAEAYLALVDPRSDIIHARALELQAWCHTTRLDFRRSAEYFRLTLLRLDDCQASDQAITATAISSLSIFAAELFDRDIARFVEERVQSMQERSNSIDWAPGLSAYRYVILEHQALFREFAGDTIKAYRLAMKACENASTVPDEVFASALRSGIARNAGEAYSAIVHAERARELLDALDPRNLNGEERFAMLSVAETCAHFDPDKAIELFAGYCELKPIDTMFASSGDPRTSAYETFVGGVIAQARGERDHARFYYRKAFDMFKDLGYVRRAVISANASLNLQLADDNDLRSYISAQLAGTYNYISKSLIRTDDRRASLERHPIVAKLPPAQREIVVLICAGKTNKEISVLRKVGEQTIKNALTKSVFPAFGVSSRAALVSTCLRERRRVPERRRLPAPGVSPRPPARDRRCSQCNRRKQASHFG